VSYKFQEEEKIRVEKYNPRNRGVSNSSRTEIIYHSPTNRVRRLSQGMEPIGGRLNRQKREIGGLLNETFFQNGGEDQDDPNASYIISSLSQYIFDHINSSSYCKIEKSDSLQISQLYRAHQRNQVNDLFQLLTEKKSPLRELKALPMLFRILSNFHCALEKLWLPYPPKFRLFYTKIGHSFLPPSVFLQFLERGIFEVTSGFVLKNVLKSNFQNVDKNEIIYAILNQLPEEESVQLMIDIQLRKGDHFKKYLFNGISTMQAENIQWSIKYGECG